jgi:glutamine synthetase
MKREDLIMICICDYAGQVRGKGFPGAERKQRLRSGIGLAPTNLMITAFGDIVETPWGPRGELIMMPDPETEVTVDLGDERPPERFLIADILQLDGRPWPCCPRGWLKSGLRALADETGLRICAAFEHEFHYSGAAQRLGDAYLLDSIRLQGTFAHTLMHAMRENGIIPDSFLPEYGPQQFEVTCKPALGLAAADQAVQLREITRAVARAHGHKATFSPVMAEGAVGNGVHIHFSFQDADGQPLGYDPSAPNGVSKAAGHFVAGVLRDMPALVALTAPSMVSYERLQPNRWSATYNNLGDRDREAGIRLCALPELPACDPARTFNLEYRAADAAASPYIALGALAWAGLQGVRDQLPLTKPTDGDPKKLSDTERKARGIERLPRSLPEALAALQASERARRWLGEEFLEAYVTHKRSEITLLENLTMEEQIARYVAAY